MHPVLDNIAVGITTTCPPPSNVLEDNDDALSTPSVSRVGTTLEEDREQGGVVRQIDPGDGVCVLDRDNYEYVDVCQNGQQSISDDDSMEYEDHNKTGGGDNYVRNLPKRELNRGWYRVYKIKGDRTMRKSKKWLRKSMGMFG